MCRSCGDARHDGPVQEFEVHRSGGGFALGWFVAVVSAGTVIDALVAGGFTSRQRVLTVAVAVVFGAIAYVLGIRPAVEEEPERLVVRNPLRDTVVPWRRLQDVRMADVLVVAAGRDVRCFAVPRRRHRDGSAGRGRQSAPTSELTSRLPELARRMSVGRADGEVVTNWSAPAVAAAATLLAAVIVIVVAW